MRRKRKKGFIGFNSCHSFYICRYSPLLSDEGAGSIHIAFCSQEDMVQGYLENWFFGGLRKKLLIGWSNIS